jgi:hypothetical protein
LSETYPNIKFALGFLNIHYHSKTLRSATLLVMHEKKEYNKGIVRRLIRYQKQNFEASTGIKLQNPHKEDSTSNSTNRKKETAINVGGNRKQWFWQERIFCEAQVVMGVNSTK